MGRHFTFLFLNAHSCSVCYPKGYKILYGLAIHNDTVYNALTRSMYGLTDSLIKLSTVTLIVAVLFMALFALIINLTKFKKKKEKC